jgi:hypothetical protein
MWAGGHDGRSGLAGLNDPIGLGVHQPHALQRLLDRLEIGVYLGCIHFYGALNQHIAIEPHAQIGVRSCGLPVPPAARLLMPARGSPTFEPRRPRDRCYSHSPTTKDERTE